MSTFYTSMLAINVIGLLLGVSNFRSAHRLGMPQTGNAIAFVGCTFGAIWSVSNLY